MLSLSTAYLRHHLLDQLVGLHQIVGVLALQQSFQALGRGKGKALDMEKRIPPATTHLGLARVRLERRRALADGIKRAEELGGGKVVGDKQLGTSPTDNIRRRQPAACRRWSRRRSAQGTARRLGRETRVQGSGTKPAHPPHTPCLASIFLTSRTLGSSGSVTDHSCSRWRMRSLTDGGGFSKY